MSKISKYVQDEIVENKKNNCTCKKCRTNFIYRPDEVKWFEFATGSDKTVTCPECGCINSIKYIYASGLNVNFDKRYYE